MRVITNVLMKGLYGLGGIISAWLGATADIIPPPTSDDPVSQAIFTLVAAAMTGIVAQVKRWLLHIRERK